MKAFVWGEDSGSSSRDAGGGAVGSSSSAPAARGKRKRMSELDDEDEGYVPGSVPGVGEDDSEDDVHPRDLEPEYFKKRTRYIPELPRKDFPLQVDLMALFDKLADKFGALSRVVVAADDVYMLGCDACRFLAALGAKFPSQMHDGLTPPELAAVRVGEAQWAQAHWNEQQWVEALSTERQAPNVILATIINFISMNPF